MTVRAVAGDNFLGGDDITEQLCVHVAAVVRRAYEIDLCYVAHAGSDFHG